MSKILALGVFSTVLMVGPTAQSQTAVWRFERLVDPMSDEVRGVASVDSDDYTLVLKCDHGTPGVYSDLYHRRSRQATAAWGGASAVTGSTSIIERVDHEEPRTADWIGNGTRRQYLKTTEETRRFAARLLAGRRLALRIPGISGDVDVIFGLSGSRAAIYNVYRACREPLPR